MIDATNNTVIDTITVGGGPHGIAYNPDNHDMYITGENLNPVSVVDTTSNTVIHTITVGDGPFGIAYNPNNYEMYVTSGSNAVPSLLHFLLLMLDQINIRNHFKPFS